MTTHYLLELTCPHCGTETETVTVGRLIHGMEGAGTETRAIVRCPVCHPSHAEFVVEVFLRPVADRQPGAPCGTAGGYRRHLREGTAIDQACTDAHARENNPAQLPAGKRRGISDWEEQRKAHVALVREMADA